jgi:hypothetical protein
MISIVSHSSFRILVVAEPNPALTMQTRSFYETRTGKGRNNENAGFTLLSVSWQHSIIGGGWSQAKKEKRETGGEGQFCCGDLLLK